MKRHGNLWEGMISFENLLHAAHAAARGKRFKPGVARFFFHLEPEPLRLQQELTPPADHELAGSRPACQCLSPANRPLW